MSRAFHNLDVIKCSLYREPYAVGWLREDVVYEKYPAITPVFLAQSMYSGRVLVIREQPAQVVWFRPYNNNWAELEGAAKAGKVTM